MIEATRKESLGIDTRPAKMGAAAVELVVAQIHRNERGSPPIPHTLLLDGVWCEGRSKAPEPKCSHAVG